MILTSAEQDLIAKIRAATIAHDEWRETAKMVAMMPTKQNITREHIAFEARRRLAMERDRAFILLKEGA